jgi:hypothetical protein
MTIFIIKQPSNNFVTLVIVSIDRSRYIYINLQWKYRGVPALLSVIGRDFLYSI